MALDRNPTDYHTEIEQAAFEPNNLVPGIGPSPDKMLLARIFAYADAHRARLGVNYKQIPVNAPKVPVHSDSKDGAMRVQNVSDPVYAPNSKGGPQADGERYPHIETWGPAGSSSTPRIPCASKTTTSVNPEPWCVKSWTTTNVPGWCPTLSATSRKA